MVLAVGALCRDARSTVSFSAGGGDAAMGDSDRELLSDGGALDRDVALLVGAAAIMGEMPRRIAVISALLVPFAGVTTFVAIDACSRHIKWAVIGPVLLPLLVASFAVVARFTTFRSCISRQSIQHCGLQLDHHFVAGAAAGGSDVNQALLPRIRSARSRCPSTTRHARYPIPRRRRGAPNRLRVSCRWPASPE